MQALITLFSTISLLGKETLPLDPEELRQLPAESLDEGRFMAEFIYMLLMLGLLIGVVLFASWLMKRMVNTRLSQLNESSNIKVLEKRTLSPKSSLYLLEIEGKTVLIAESGTHITQLQVDLDTEASK